MSASRAGSKGASIRLTRTPPAVVNSVAVAVATAVAVGVPVAVSGAVAVVAAAAVRMPVVASVAGGAAGAASPDAGSICASRMGPLALPGPAPAGRARERRPPGCRAIAVEILQNSNQAPPNGGATSRCYGSCASDEPSGTSSYAPTPVPRPPASLSPAAPGRGPHGPGPTRHPSYGMGE